MAHGKAKLSLLDKVENGRLKVQQGLSRAVLAVTTKTSSRRRMHCAVNPVAMTPSRWQFYPSSQPVFMDLAKKGVVADLMAQAQSSEPRSAAMLWRGRYANQQRFEYSPHHA